jgi:ribosomal protein S18 acetylase RimI-like enzyme
MARSPDEPMEMIFRLMTMADVPAGMRLKDLAGWNQTAADWERFLSASPSGCFVAEVEGRVVGTTTTIVYEGRFAWIGMVLVDPEFRGRGIGTHLLNKAIEHLDSQGVPTLKLDATPEGQPLYEKLGFVREYEIERWTLDRPGTGSDSRSLGGSSLSNLQAIADWQSEIDNRKHVLIPQPRENGSAIGIGPPELEDVLELDREVFGADRGDLLRSLVSAAPEFALAVRERGGLAGYAFGRYGSRADHLGPWTARTESAGRGLLEEFLKRSSRERLLVDCLKFHPWAETLLRARGFEFSRPLTRMYRGPNDHPGRPGWLCAILGPEFG